MSEVHAVDVFFTDPPVLAVDVVLAQGVKGNEGVKGDAGEGVATGGTTGQLLTKASGTDFDTSWEDTANPFDQDLNTTDSVTFTGLDLNDGVTPTALTLTNTDDGAGNSETGFMKWNANVLEIGTEADGTGVARKVEVITDGHIILNGSQVRTDDLYPSANNSKELGHSTLRWKNINTQKINQRTESAADPTTTEYPKDKDSGVHLNTTSGLLYLCHNYSGTIYKTQLT